MTKHVRSLHAGLAAQLDLSNYRTELYDTYSIQSCGATADSSADTATSEASSASSSKSKKRNTKHPIAAANLAAASKSVDFPERLKGGALYAFVYVVLNACSTRARAQQLILTRPGNEAAIRI